MNPTLKRYLRSSLTTALTIGSATLALMLSMGPIQWTSAFWFTLSMTVLRAVWKGIVENLSKQNNDL